jgi:hypothetical protein
MLRRSCRFYNNSNRGSLIWPDHVFVMRKNVVCAGFITMINDIKNSLTATDWIVKSRVKKA